MKSNSNPLKHRKYLSFSYMSMYFIRTILILFVTVLLGHETTHAQSERQLPGVRAELQKVAEDDAQRISEAIAQNSRVQVVLELDVDNFRPESQISKSEAVFQRAQIHQRAQQFAEYAASDEISIGRTFQVFPYVVASVTQAGYQELQNSAQVRRIFYDRIASVETTTTNEIIGATEAWNSGYTGSGTTVVVLDTGTQTDHPGLQNNIEDEACFSTNNSGMSVTSTCTDNDPARTGAGSYPCFSLSSGLNTCDHGTHVSGIIVGNDPVDGHSGVAPDAGLIPIQVFSEFDNTNCGSGPRPCLLSFSSDQFAALEHVYLNLIGIHNITAVNMSLGGTPVPTPCDNYFLKEMVDLLRAENIPTVIASGNDSDTNGINFPACISSSVSVGSVNNIDVVSSFTNSGTFLDLLAPGQSIRSTFIGGGYGTKNGTSMAAPMASGAFTLLREKFPDDTVQELLVRLQKTGVPVTDTRNAVNRTRMRIQVDDALNSENPRLITMFTENFDDPEMPALWTNTDLEGGGKTWRFDNPGNMTFDFDGNFAIMDSDWWRDENGAGLHHAVLTTPVIPVENMDAVLLSIRHHMALYPGSPEAEIYTEVSIDGDDWYILKGWLTEWGGLGFGVFDPGNHQSLIYYHDITQLAKDASTIQVRWGFIGDFNGWWAIDEFNVYGIDALESTDVFSAEFEGTNEGWRMVASPVGATTYGEIFDNLWTQGYAGSDAPSAAANVIFYDEAAREWRIPSADTDLLGTDDNSLPTTAGKAAMIYMFGDDDYSGGPATWPKVLTVEGYRNYGDVIVELSYNLENPLGVEDDTEGWNLVGNPYPFPVDWQLMVDNGALHETSSVIFLWDANQNEGDGTWRFHPGTTISGIPDALTFSGKIAPFQGFFARATDEGAEIRFRLIHNADEADLFDVPKPQSNQNALVLNVSSNGIQNTAVILQNDGQEPVAVERPVHFGSRYITPGLTYDGKSDLSVLKLLEFFEEDKIIPLHYFSTESGVNTLSIIETGKRLHPVRILDHHTGIETELRGEGEFEFYYEAEKSRLNVDREPLDISSMKISQKLYSESPRFSLIIPAGQSTETEFADDLPNKISLDQNYPNPFNPTTVIQFGLPEPGEIRLEVFNVLGQRVAVLADGVRQAGYHTLNFDASRLAGGLYLYRLSTPQGQITRKMMLVK